jgi:hypothetical protein
MQGQQVRQLADRRWIVVDAQIDGAIAVPAEAAAGAHDDTNPGGSNQVGFFHNDLLRVPGGQVVCQPCGTRQRTHLQE